MPTSACSQNGLCWDSQRSFFCEKLKKIWWNGKKFVILQLHTGRNPFAERKRIFAIFRNRETGHFSRSYAKNIENDAPDGYYFTSNIS